MPRHLRLCAPHLPLHVMQRGNNRSACFVDERDRTLYLGLLEELGKRFECEVHAYVLMPNHSHLLLTPNHASSPSLLMKHVGQRYAQHMNRKYCRTGTLWEGRFKSSIVDSDSYFITCQHYIEANPVRAALSVHAAQYPWSSFRTNALGAPSTLVVPHDCYLALGNDEGSRRTAYAALFDLPQDEKEVRRIREAINGGFALGSDDFLEKLQREVGVGAVRRSRKRP